MKKTIAPAPVLSVQATVLPVLLFIKWIILLAIGILVLASCKKGADPQPSLPDTGNPTVLETNITEKTVLADLIANPDLPDYVVSKSIDVNNELTLSPGVVIAFERDVRLNVNDNGGVLIAKGTPEKRIKLIGAQSSKGYWSGIMLYSGSSANILEYADVMHAASKPLYSATKTALFLSGGSQAQIAIKNSLFSQNDGYGVYVYPGGILREFSQNTFSNHTESGIILDADNVTKLDAASVFTANNGRNVVELLPSSTIKGTAEVVWSAFADNTPYRINGEFAANTGWKLNPGVKIEMNQDAVIRINSGGYVIAQGTATSKVVFTSTNETATYWRGIICYSASSKNLIENAEIRHAGSIPIVSNKKANVAVYGSAANLTIKSSRISGSGGYGVFVSYGSKANTDIATTNTFESNSQTNVFVEWFLTF